MDYEFHAGVLDPAALALPLNLIQEQAETAGMTVSRDNAGDYIAAKSVAVEIERDGQLVTDEVTTKLTFGLDGTGMITQTSLAGEVRTVKITEDMEVKVTSEGIVLTTVSEIQAYVLTAEIIIDFDGNMTQAQSRESAEGILIQKTESTVQFDGTRISKSLATNPLTEESMTTVSTVELDGSSEVTRARMDANGDVIDESRTMIERENGVTTGVVSIYDNHQTGAMTVTRQSILEDGSRMLLQAAKTDSGITVTKQIRAPDGSTTSEALLDVAPESLMSIDALGNIIVVEAVEIDGETVYQIHTIDKMGNLTTSRYTLLSEAMDAVDQAGASINDFLNMLDVIGILTVPLQEALETEELEMQSTLMLSEIEALIDSAERTIPEIEDQLALWVAEFDGSSDEINNGIQQLEELLNNLEILSADLSADSPLLSDYENQIMALVDQALAYDDALGGRISDMQDYLAAYWDYLDELDWLMADVDAAESLAELDSLINPEEPDYLGDFLDVMNPLPAIENAILEGEELTEVLENAIREEIQGREEAERQHH